MDEHVIGKNNIGIYRLWLSFTLAMLLFVLPVASSILIPILYYPLVGVVVSLTVYLILKRRRKSMRFELDCMIVVYIVNRAIFFYSIFVLISNLILSSDLDFNTVVMNPESGFNFNLFPVLILAPLVAFFANQAIRKRITYCVYCVACKGFSSERNMCGIIQSREVLTVLRLVRINGILLTVLGWAYFIFIDNKYVEVEPFDRLVFIGVPVIVILINEIILTIRYLTISIFNDKEYGSSQFKENKTLIRYILISDENIFIQKNPEGTFDTPFVEYEKSGAEISCDAAKVRFKELYGDIDAVFKPMYTSIDKSHNSRILRFFVFVKDENTIKKDGMWVSLNFLMNLYSVGNLKRGLRNELYRVTTAITSYKLFDENGNRRPDLNHNLSLSISDIKNDKIDFSDMRWMRFSMKINNSLKNRIQRTFYKYVEGIID